ncbi:phosphate acyltransferase [Desertibacillus haloalkaliphilus]|uniref:phosphate acyltransferase n=1 Tax=Desertibacillus haloalkaliphilus TaxID=1328930 RepID=UPI001C2767E6|nr:phosphate acyltransferase [Desertibacillus haloalkaliphilus]MBU8906044.1 phosphate butyryltransferase [Desertibacillus haloalkaliphilus]
MRFKNFSEMITHARKGSPVKISVAAAHDRHVLSALKEACQHGIISPVLIGRENEIEALSNQINFNCNNYEIFSADSDQEAAYLAAKLADEGYTDAIMKGLVNSTPFLKSVLHADLNLKTGKLISHLSAFEIPGVDYITYMTDGGLNIAPTVSQKEQIVSNAIEFLDGFGVPSPKVVLLSANEQINQKMPVTTEWARLTRKLSRTYPRAIIEGPLPLDLAISPESLAHKNIDSKVNGRADLLVVPTIEAGNIFAKSITYYAKGIMAGVVLGAKVPLILNSRSDSPLAKLASIALVALSVTEQRTIENLLQINGQ